MLCGDVRVMAPGKRGNPALGSVPGVRRASGATRHANTGSITCIPKCVCLDRSRERMVKMAFFLCLRLYTFSRIQTRKVRKRSEPCPRSTVFAGAALGSGAEELFCAVAACPGGLLSSSAGEGLLHP